MKNKVFYDVVSKTKLINVFTKNKVMLNTYFGEVSPTLGWSLDFSDSFVQNSLLNAEVSTDTTTASPSTFYKRNDVASITASDVGVVLKGTGAGSSGRVGFMYALPELVTTKISFETEFKINKLVETPTYGTTSLLTGSIIPNVTGTATPRFDIYPTYIKCSAGESFNAPFPEGVTAYDYLTIKIEYDVRTRSVTWYCNGQVLHTAVGTGVELPNVAVCNYSGASNSTAQNETSITMYSIDTVVEE